MPIYAGSFRNYRECGTFWYMTHLVVRGGGGGGGGSGFTIFQSWKSPFHWGYHSLSNLSVLRHWWQYFGTCTNTAIRCGIKKKKIKIKKQNKVFSNLTDPLTEEIILSELFQGGSSVAVLLCLWVIAFICGVLFNHYFSLSLLLLVPLEGCASWLWHFLGIFTYISLSLVYLVYMS